MIGEKSHVGLMQCYYCGEAFGVVLDRRLRDTLPREAVYDTEPCDECKALMEQGVLLISVKDGSMEREAALREAHEREQRYLPKKKQVPYMDNPHRTGGWVVVTDDFIRRLIADDGLRDDILRRRMSWLEDEAWDAIGLPRGEVEGGTEAD